MKSGSRSREGGINGRKWNIRAKLKSILRQKSGVTLVELIVAFALLSLFAVSSCQIVSNAIGVYHKIRGTNNVIQAADTLLDKITGEIAEAQSAPLPGEAETAVKISGGGTRIELQDETASHICITSTDKKGDIPDYKPTPGSYSINQLLIYYYPVLDESGTENRFDAVDWTFDKAVYMGCEVESLSFALADQTLYPKNVVKVDLALKRGGNIYNATRYVRCYNLEAEEDKIADDGGGSTGGGGGPAGPDNDTYPGTNIEIWDSYWPKQEEWSNDVNKTILVHPGGIFKYEDGKYYVVTKETPVTKGQGASGPGGEAYNWFHVERLTGRVFEFVGEEQRSDLKRGDICLYKGKYYVFNDGGQYGYSPGKDPVHWYEIPMK